MDPENTLEELEQDAEALLAELTSGRELPRVQRSLQQMRSAGERLAARSAISTTATSGGVSAPDVLAARLLADQGQQLQMPRLPGKLETSGVTGLSTLSTLESLEPAADTDIYAFLNNERDNAMLTAIEKTRKQTFEESEERCLRAIHDDWEREKQSILNALVGPHSTDLPELRPTGRVEETMGMEHLHSGSESVAHRSTLSAVELSLARALDLHTAAVCAGGSRPDLCTQLAQAATGAPGAPAPTDLWSLVEVMCKVESFGGGGSGSVLDIRTSRRAQEAWVVRALRHLEAGFASFVRSVVLQSLPRAQLGGVPGPRATIRGFVALRLQQAGASIEQLEDGLVDGRPVWPFIFYCLRAGEGKEALAVAREATNNLGDFASFLEEYISSDVHRLSASSETKIRLQYRRSVRVGTDPYKRAVYCLLGRCEPADHHPDIVTQVEDFLWLKLRQISWSEAAPASAESSSSSAAASAGAESMSLMQLQKLLSEEYGEAHFQAWEQPLLYFTVLFLTQQFESALAFLAGTESLRCHAVHFALALHDRHLLLLAPSIQAQLLSRENTDPVQVRRLNLARLVMLYTRKFEVTDPREALNYYYALRELRTADTGGKGESLFVKCVAELALESCEFGLLLGRLDAQGVRLPGAVDRYQVDVPRLISSVAATIEARGRLEEAAHLLELAGEDSRLVLLLCQLLASCVSTSPSSPERQRRMELCRDIAARLRLRGTNKAATHSLSSLFHLLDLGTFFELCYSEDTEAALRLMDELRLLPTASEQVESKIGAFGRLSDDVRRTLPELLLAMMKILLTKYQRLKMTPASPRGEGSGNNSKVLAEVRTRASALVEFAGCLPYRMPGDVYARLSELEIQLN